MADEDAILYTVDDDGIAWLTINRPEARNAMNAAVRQGLFDGFARFDADDAAKVLVLTATGDKAFCAGGDLKEMSATALKVPPKDHLPHLQRNVMVSKPVIAAVNGIAYAGGFLLTQMCDLAIAADHAKFAITEVKVGRGAPWAAPLPWLVPPRVAMEILVTGDPLDAERAYQVGLVNKVVPLAELHGAAKAMAMAIAANAPLSVKAGKALVYMAAEHLRTAAWDEGDKLFESVYLSEDAQEGPLSFVEKRKPVWKGR